ncbi:MAG: MaoC/PaaZ C-terminal domain-containing protein [Roseiarcus sp.]
MIVGWEDFPVGREIITHAVTVTETHVVQFATLTGDWYPLHMDAEFAAATPFGRRIAHGPLVFTLAVGLMYQRQCFGHAIIAWLGAEKMRATAPTFFGDTLHVVATVLSSRASERAGRGVVVLQYVVKKQNGGTVMSFEFALLMRARDAAAADGA